MRIHREGFTFIELLLVMVIGLALVGSAYGIIVRQQSAYGVLNARASTQQDARTGVEMLTAEFRELSASGGDLLMATPDSIRFRGLRKFGILCDKDNSSKKLTVAQIGVDTFRAGDSLWIYVDTDSLKATDDSWHRDYAGSVSTVNSCATTLGGTLPSVLPNAHLVAISLPGVGLKFESVFPGAPIRSFEHLSYRPGTWRGQNMLMRAQGGAAVPLFGPISEDDGFVVSYFDTLGAPLTSFPLNAADRGSVGRLRIEVRSERMTGHSGPYTDSLITDIYLRGN